MEKRVEEEMNGRGARGNGGVKERRRRKREESKDGRGKGEQGSISQITSLS